MTKISGVSFEEAWVTRTIARFGEAEVGFLGREALLQNKRATGRPKDLVDVALLSKRH